MSQSKPTTKDVHEEVKSTRAEIADVKRAIGQHFADLRDGIGARFEGIEKGIDSRADNLLGRVAASDYSALIVIGCLAGAFAIGAVLF